MYAFVFSSGQTASCSAVAEHVTTRHIMYESRLTKDRQILWNLHHHQEFVDMSCICPFHSSCRNLDLEGFCSHSWSDMCMFCLSDTYPKEALENHTNMCGGIRTPPLDSVFADMTSPPICLSTSLTIQSL